MSESADFVYLDNAATTYPKPACVYELATEFYRRYGGNAGRGANPLARKCQEMIDETRQLLAICIGAPHPEQVVFTPSATVALNLAILGARLQTGDVVYVTPFEHNSVLRPLEHLRKKVGIAVQELPFERQTMSCQIDRLTAQFQADPPALICVTQASNVCGVMPSVVEIARLAKEANPNVVIVVDGAQAAGLYELPLTAGMIDAYIFSGHKSLYGPYGVAGLVLASEWRPTPILFGGTGTVSESLEMPEDAPSTYESGSHNIWALAGLGAAVRWLNETGRRAIVAHTLQLARQLRNSLETMPGVQMYVPPPERQWCGIVSWRMSSVSPQSIESVLGARGIMVRAGLHCAAWAHRWMATIADGGTVRVSAGYFNHTDDIVKLIENIAYIAQM